MPLDTIKILDVEQDVTIKNNRSRKKPGDIEGLAKSLRDNGQIDPIIIQDGVLVAGWRRCMAVLYLKTKDQAVKDLEPGQIEAREKSDLSSLELLIIEYEENKRRKAFEEAEEAVAIAKIKAQLEEIKGKAITNRQLAKELHYSTGQIGMALEVAGAVEEGDNDELLQEKSIAGAYKKLKTKEKLETILSRVKEAEDEGDVDTSFLDRLHHGDAVSHLQSLDAESFDLVHLDPPWGIGIDSYDRHQNYGTFDDSPDIGAQLAQDLIPEAYRILKSDTYLLLWFGIQYYQPLFDLITSVGFHLNPVPFIWHKTNKAGAQSDPSRITINCWEPLFIAAKGDPRMFKHAGRNILEFPMPKERTHFAQKDLGMLKELIERFSATNMHIIDPTFGSGSFLVAAQEKGRVFYGAEKDKTYFDNAINWLKTAQVMQ